MNIHDTDAIARMVRIATSDKLESEVSTVHTVPQVDTENKGFVEKMHNTMLENSIEQAIKRTKNTEDWVSSPIKRYKNFITPIEEEEQKDITKAELQEMLGNNNLQYNCKKVFEDSPDAPSLFTW